jgi:hypothetical protein
MEKEKKGLLFRCWIKHVERAWLSLQLCGVAMNIETPSDWHEEKLIWLHVGLGVLRFGISLPWHGQIVPDNGQCSGPRWGFQFFEDLLWIYYGKDKTWSFYMPWHWKHQWHRVLMADQSWKTVASGFGIEGSPWNWTDKWQEVHSYHYCLKNWTIQERTATIGVEERCWTRLWFPFKKVSRCIEIQFSDEVGERTGSWKGGTIGCGYELRKDETPLECLRRMERERKF